VRWIVLAACLAGCAKDEGATPGGGDGGETTGSGGPSVTGGACVAPDIHAPVLELEGVVSEAFEDVPLSWWMPEQPRGFILFFHGSKGTFGQVTGLEVLSVLNLLAPLGYGFASTNSTLREDAEWDVSSRDPAVNADLGRLMRLRDHLVSTTALEQGTPVYTMGFSDGGNMAAWFADVVFTEHGWPVHGASIHNSPISASLAGDLPLPTFFSVSEHDNDNVVSGARSRHEDQLSAGDPSEFWEVAEIALDPMRFVRIDPFGEYRSQKFFDELVALDFVDAEGERTLDVDIDDDTALTDALLYFERQSEDTEAWLVTSQLRVVWATHRFSGFYNAEECLFIEAQNSL
jgi:hypothetical protein